MAAAATKAPPSPFAEAQVFEEQQRVDREGVVELDHVDVTRPQPGHLA
jgi:hypothetical protein